MQVNSLTSPSKLFISGKISKQNINKISIYLLRSLATSFDLIIATSILHYIF